MIKAKTTAVVLRKSEDGKVMILGSVLDNLDGVLFDENEYLFIGELTLTPKHIFHTYKIAPGTSPNELLMNDGLDYKSYKTKLL